MADNRITMVDINGVVRVLDARYVAALEAENKALRKELELAEKWAEGRWWNPAAAPAKEQSEGTGKSFPVRILSMSSFPAKEPDE